MEMISYNWEKGQNEHVDKEKDFYMRHFRYLRQLLSDVSQYDDIGQKYNSEIPQAFIVKVILVHDMDVVIA